MTAPVRIAITGEFRRGKDTVADILSKELAKSGTDITRLAFADALKRELADMTWQFIGRPQIIARKTGNRVASWKDRAAWVQSELEARQRNGIGWQWLGEYRRTTVSEDYWVDHPTLQGKFQNAVKQGHHILMTDLRHHNELAWCKAHGFYTIRIEGPCRALGDVRDRNHPSEVHVRELDVNRTIYNGSTLATLEGNVLKYALPWAKAYCDEWKAIADPGS